VQGLRAAALDGVDVRLLVPGTSDVRVIPLLSRAGYRPLLEAGVRIFEWDGPMLHAKTAVADGRWARVGSTNLNLASWVGNWELDLVVEDATFAAELEAMHEDDRAHATEVVLDGQRVRSRASRRPRLTPAAVRGSARVAAVGALRVGATIGAAISRRRTLEPAEARVAALAGVLLLAVSMVAILWPVVLALPLAVLSGWVAISLFVQGWRLRLRGRTARDARTTR
jgi:cardiolipin synthase